MAYLRNLTDTDLEVPSLEVTVPAGQAVEVDQNVPTVDDPLHDHPLLKATKTAPKNAPVATTPEEN